MTPKEIYNILRCNPSIRIVTKVYKGIDWLCRKDMDGVVGFLCKVNSELGKSDKLEKVREYCQRANLPVEVIDLPERYTEFKIVILNKAPTPKL